MGYPKRSDAVTLADCGRERKQGWIQPQSRSDSGAVYYCLAAPQVRVSHLAGYVAADSRIEAFIHRPEIFAVCPQSGIEQC